MAEFDTELNVREPNSFLNYSRGVDVNTQGDSSLGKLFSGVGEVITMTTKAISEEFGRRIQQEAYAGIDEVRNETIDGAVTMQKAPGAPTTPEEINRAGQQLDRLKQAALQGKLQESHYQARVEAVSRQLRAKYAGHREEIDAMVSRINGGNPANKLRDSLVSEAETAAKLAQGAANRYDTFVDSAIKDGRLTGMEATMAKSGRLTQEEVYRVVADREFQDKAVSRESAMLALRKARGEEVTKASGEFLNKSAQDILNDTSSSAISVFAKDNKELTEFQRKALAGQITPQDGEAFVRLVSNAQTEAQTRLNRVIQEATKAGVQFNQQQLDEARKRVNGHFSTLIEAATNKDWGAIAETKRMYDAQMESEKLKFIQPEFMRRAATAKAIMGENVYLQSLTLGSDTLKASQLHMKQYLLNGFITGTGGSFKDTVEEAKRLAADKTEAAQTVREATQQGVNLLADPKTPVQAAKNIAESFFGEQNMHTLRGMTESSKAQTFEMFTNPAVTKRMVQLKETDPKTWNNYVSWITNNTFVYGMRPVSDLQARVSDPASYYSVAWDAASNQFISVPSKQLKSASEAQAAKVDEIKARTLVRELNSYTRPMVDIAKAEGLEPQARVGQYIRSSGIDLNAITVNQPADTKAKFQNIPGWDDQMIGNIAGMVAQTYKPGNRESTNVEDRRNLAPGTPIEVTRGGKMPKFDPNDPMSASIGGGMAKFESQLGRVSPEVAEKLRNSFSPEQLDQIFKFGENKRYTFDKLPEEVQQLTKATATRYTTYGQIAEKFYDVITLNNNGEILFKDLIPKYQDRINQIVDLEDRLLELEKLMTDRPQDKRAISRFKEVYSHYTSMVDDFVDDAKKHGL